MNNDRYFPGQYLGLDSTLKKRCAEVVLLGPNRIVRIEPLRILNPNHIDFCFGSRNVHVHFQNIAGTTLEHWLNRGEVFAEDIVGFSGPAGTVLYIVFKKNSIL